MKAISNKRARSLLRAGIVLGVAASAAIGTACSKETSVDEEQDQGIGVSHIDPVVNTAEADSPLDATPSPDGSQVYFIAFSRAPGPDGIALERTPAIFRVPATGGAPQKLAGGDPLVSPFNITISDDGQTLFIADSAADTGDDLEGGKVFSLNVAGGTPTALAGTEGLHPAGVEAMGDTLYVTGSKDGQAGLYRTPLGGGAVTPVAVGGPFVDPGGVAVTKKGVAYVVDTGSVASEQSLASVVKVSPDGSTEVVIDGLSVGHPAGIALIDDDAAVLVSGLDAVKGTDTVFRVELGDRSLRTFSDVIGGFYESAGLHRARGAEVFAWADSHANATGTVFVLRK